MLLVQENTMKLGGVKLPGQVEKSVYLKRQVSKISRMIKARQKQISRQAMKLQRSVSR